MRDQADRSADNLSAGWIQSQLDSLARHIQSMPPYNQDQIARALTGIADGREWEAMVWR